MKGEIEQNEPRSGPRNTRFARNDAFIAEKHRFPMSFQLILTTKVT